MACQACQLPDTLDTLNHAFLWPPQGHTLYKIAQYLDEQGYQFENVVAEQYVKVNVTAPNKFIVGLSGLLTESERTDTRILMSETPEPSMGDFGSVMTLNRMMERLRGDW